MSTLVMIPSRLASTRFPNKPLADLGGKPMVVRVYEQALKARCGAVYVAAGDEGIAAAVRAAGGQVVMTDAGLPNGSERIWQGVQRLMVQGVPQPEFIINAQGDEPLLPPELITQAVAALQADEGVDVVTFAHEITDRGDINNPTKVKVVTTRTGRALYFSRHAIPYGAAEAGLPLLRHIGFYGYRYAALKRYIETGEGKLENVEKLEQLRGLELGLHYHIITTPHEPIGVDTPADLEAVKRLMGLLQS
jgi:3-deoxy-manno-octulosonate cytidylyltransferase (CMP-KDO synthetase)